MGIKPTVVTRELAGRITRLEVHGRRADARIVLIVGIGRFMLPNARPISLAKREFVDFSIFIEIDTARRGSIGVILVLEKLRRRFNPFVK